jgi:hypothetical protein
MELCHRHSHHRYLRHPNIHRSTYPCGAPILDFHGSKNSDWVMKPRTKSGRFFPYPYLITVHNSDFTLHLTLRISCSWSRPRETGTGNFFFRCKAAGASTWKLTPTWRRGYVRIQLEPYSHMVLNKAQGQFNCMECSNSRAIGNYLKVCRHHKTILDSYSGNARLKLGRIPVILIQVFRSFPVAKNAVAWPSQQTLEHVQILTPNLFWVFCQLGKSWQGQEAGIFTWPACSTKDKTL